MMLPFKNSLSLSASIRIIFLAFGAISITVSYFAESSVLALIGLGLVFWGALFFFIAPTRQVDASLLSTSSIALYTSIDRISSNYNLKGKGYYIPAYPKDVYLPEHLKGLKDIVVYISANGYIELPAIDELAEGKFQVKNSKGILIVPPGLGLLDDIEAKFKKDLAKIKLEELTEVLPAFLMENYSLAKNISMNVNDKNEIRLKMYDSVYGNLYRAERHLRSVRMLGCPLASAVACILSKVSGRPVAMQRSRISLDGLTVEVQFNIKGENVE